MELDPVCGMHVDPKTATVKSSYQGKTYYFCSPGCQKSFEQDPGRYVVKPKEAQKGDSHRPH